MRVAVFENRAWSVAESVVRVSPMRLVFVGRVAKTSDSISVVRFVLILELQPSVGRHPPTGLHQTEIPTVHTSRPHSTLFLLVLFHPNDLNTTSPLVEPPPKTLKSYVAALIAAAAARRPISTFSPVRLPPSPLLTPRPRPSPLLFPLLRKTLPTSKGRSRSTTTLHCSSTREPRPCKSPPLVLRECL